MHDKFLIIALNKIFKTKKRNLYNIKKQFTILLGFLSDNKSQHYLDYIHDYVFSLNAGFASIKIHVYKILKKSFYYLWIKNIISKENLPFVSFYFSYLSMKEQSVLIKKLEQDLPEFNLDDFIAIKKRLTPFKEAIIALDKGNIKLIVSYISQAEVISKLQIDSIFNIINKGKNLYAKHSLAIVVDALKKYPKYYRRKLHISDFASPPEVFKEYIAYHFKHIEKLVIRQTTPLNCYLNEFSFEQIVDIYNFSTRTKSIVQFGYSLLYNVAIHPKGDHPYFLNNINWFLNQPIPYLKLLSKKFRIDFSNDGLLNLIYYCDQHNNENICMEGVLDVVDYDKQAIIGRKYLLHHKLNEALVTQASTHKTIKI